MPRRLLLLVSQQVDGFTNRLITFLKDWLLMQTLKRKNQKPLRQAVHKMVEGRTNATLVP